jgi:RNA polymerase sigma-70 factor (ECF subfamily)
MDRSADMALPDTARADGAGPAASYRREPGERLRPAQRSAQDKRPPAAAGKPDLSEAVRAAQQGDEQAFRVLYRDMQPRLLRYLRTMVADEAEDVASEAWLHITRDLAGFSGDSDGFRGWAATIARHRAMDHQRRHRRRPQSAPTPIEDLGDLAAGDDTAQSALDTVATQAAVQMIADLPPDQAEAVMLRVVMGLDAESAGQVLGKKAGAVRTAAYRGLRRLGTRLEQAGAGDK